MSAGTESQTTIHELDLEAEVCPFSLIKSRNALEALSAGEVLEVTLGNRESAANVPRSLDLEGHEVISVDQAGAGVWKVQIKRNTK